VNNAKEFIPSLVESYNSTSDGHTWTLNLRQNVKWHTGWTFSADDVIFSFMSAMNTQVGSKKVGYYTGVFGDYVKLRWVNGTDTYLYYNATSTATQFNPDPASVPSATRTGNITAVDSNTIQLYLPNIKGLDYPYGFFEIDTLGYSNNIMPKHILEQVPPADWTTCPFNTGQGSYPITLANGTAYTITGPVGTGPYKWVGFDATAQLVTLKKFDSYWNKTNLEAIGQFGIENYYVRFIADKTAALAALKNGEVDLLDQNYQMTSDISTIDPSWGKVFLLEGAGRQELGINMRHPILGTGTGTPLGTAEAARNVRLAIDYAIPRQLIIDNLLDGYGTPGITACLPTQLYFNTTMSARPYSMAKAREHLEAAGYTVPTTPTTTVSGFIQGMSNRLSGTWTDTDGNAMPDKELQIGESYDNETYQMIETVKTDLNGRWSTIVVPPNTGTVYYRLYDPTGVVNTGTEYYKQLGSWNVTTLSASFTPVQNQITSLQNNMNDQIAGLRTQNNYLIIGIVIAIIIAIIAIFLGRRG
jgi:ABC-type transport system substrate-binding protein